MENLKLHGILKLFLVMDTDIRFETGKFVLFYFGAMDRKIFSWNPNAGNQGYRYRSILPAEVQQCFRQVIGSFGFNRSDNPNDPIANFISDYINYMGVT